MVYILGALIAILIVLGQVLWKYGATSADLVMTRESILTLGFLKFLFSPYIILGAVSYAFATVLFMVMLAKHEYTSLQSVVVSSSLLFTFVAAVTLFDESVSIINIVGLVMLIGGVVLITKF